MKEREDQRSGRNKNTAVNKSYLESGDYRRKFDKISDNPRLNKLLYQLAKKILIHRSGTMYEDMYWIDPSTLEIVAEEKNDIVEMKVTYSTNTRKAIKFHDMLVTIHNHPLSHPPSEGDLNANYIYNYYLGIVVGHDGRVFAYSSNEYLPIAYYEMKVANNILNGYNELEAQIEALKELSEKYEFYVKEVTCDED